MMKASWALVTLGLVLRNSSCYAECSDESAARFAAGQASKIEFENQIAGHALSIYKLDQSGSRRLYLVLAPGSKLVAPTFVTEPWVVVDQVSGACLALFKSDGDRRFPITRFLLEAAVGASIPIQATPKPAVAAAPIAAQPDSVEQEETYNKRKRNDCEYVAKQCYKSAERDYNWYMSFFHRDQLDPSDYSAEQSRASRERKESIEQCLASRNECLSDIPDDD